MEKKKVREERKKYLQQKKMEKEMEYEGREEKEIDQKRMRK